MPTNPLFKLGRLLMTPGAMEALQASRQSPWAFLTRHMAGDWGEVDSEDKALNDAAVKDGTRILSAYTTASGTRLWIITEADRSATTILLPDEY
ncbi:MAG: hypothetical protein K2R98_09505 [Gemmataceae bacterium]|nr:hypothetical protein [Gemmataceae bacterium]